MHGDQEPKPAQRRAGVPPAQRARQRERFRFVGVADLGRRDARPTLRFMESLLSLWRVHRDHEPTPNPSQEGNYRGADESQFPSWEGSGVGRFMEMVTECAGGRNSDDALESFKTKNPSLRTPDVVEKRWSDRATWRRILLPLLVAPLAHPMGEGSGVRARESGGGLG